MKEVFLLVFLLVIAGCSYCGDGKLDAGETKDNCCMDAGCEGEMECVDNQCNECGECQYVLDHVCMDYGCCDDDGCLDNEKCENHECKSVECGECQFVLDHKCVRYECCDDNDCLGSERCVDNSCEELLCGECEFIEDHKCVQKECCDDADCSSDELCLENKCVKLDCGCGVVDEHKCIEYSCCSDADCYDDDYKTADICINAATENSECVHRDNDLNIAIVELGKKEVLDYQIPGRFTMPDEGTCVDMLNSRGVSYDTLYSIPGWFRREADKYGAEFNLGIDILGSFEVDDVIYRERNESCSSMEGYFREQIENNDLDLNEYDFTVFLFIGQNEFVSCTDRSEGFAYVNGLAYPSCAYNTIVGAVMHEIVHLLGASDKYSVGEGFAVCDEEKGIPEPERYPLFPQEKACVMCRQIMLSETSFSSSTTTENVVMCPKTAEEIGWI